MALTDAGGILTVQHRQAQVSLRARALRDFIRIWPLWDGDEQTFDRLVAASLPLVRAHHRISTALAAAYYQSFRTAERAPGVPTPRLAVLDSQRVAASLHVTGRVMTAKAIAAGYKPEAAMQVALVRTSGAVARHVLAGGRETLVQSTKADPRAGGWTRVVSPGACSFCQELASQGSTAGDFQAHDHCACAAEPDFS